MTTAFDKTSPLRCTAYLLTCVHEVLENLPVGTKTLRMRTSTSLGWLAAIKVQITANEDEDRTDWRQGIVWSPNKRTQENESRMCLKEFRYRKGRLH